jgi:hypothetical protein
MGNPIRDQSPTGRYTVSEAAGVLGISVEAVRGRVKRGTLKSERTEGGTVYVYVAKLGDRTRPAPDQSNDRPTDQALMVARLEDEVEFLRDQVRRQQEIIAQQAVTMRQLTAAAQEEPTEDAQTVEEEPERAEPRPGAPGAQEGAQRPWWRRMFGRA